MISSSLVDDAFCNKRVSDAAHERRPNHRPRSPPPSRKAARMRLYSRCGTTYEGEEKGDGKMKGDEEMEIARTAREEARRDVR